MRAHALGVLARGHSQSAVVEALRFEEERRRAHAAARTGGLVAAAAGQLSGAEGAFGAQAAAAFTESMEAIFAARPQEMTALAAEAALRTGQGLGQADSGPGERTFV